MIDSSGRIGIFSFRITRPCFSFIRHWCDQSDRLKYGWTYHDGETFGIEQISDENLQLNVQWLKQVTGNHGGDWTTRINVTPQVYPHSRGIQFSILYFLFF